MTAKPPVGKPGPEAERLKIEEDWERAVAKAFKAKKPELDEPKEVKKPARK